MEMKLFYLGEMMGCAYLTWNEEKEATLFDCGGENLENMFAFLETHRLNLKRVMLTHGHYDHIAGINKMLEYKSDIEFYIGEEEVAFLSDSSLSLSGMLGGGNFKFKGDVKPLKDGDIVGDFIVIDTPGHTRGSKCYYNEKAGVIFSGDTMFRNSHGRVDLPTGNPSAMKESLRKLVSNYPGEVEVYSGHTEGTTLAAEKRFLTFNGLI